MTHYIPAFTEYIAGRQRAVCGAWVTHKEHAVEPTCEGCKHYLEGGTDGDNKEPNRKG